MLKLVLTPLITFKCAEQSLFKLFSAVLYPFSSILAYVVQAFLSYCFPYFLLFMFSVHAFRLIVFILYFTQLQVSLVQCFSTIFCPPMERENISCPPFATNKSIIYRNSICIPVPRNHTRLLQHFIPLGVRLTTKVQSMHLGPKISGVELAFLSAWRRGYTLWRTGAIKWNSQRTVHFIFALQVYANLQAWRTREELLA